MVYQKHSIWEDEDKWDIHKSNDDYSKGGGYKKDDKGAEYKQEQEYGSNKDEPGSDYMKKKDSEDKKEDEKKDELSEAVEQEKKYDKDNKAEENDVQIQAAKEIHQELKGQPEKSQKKKSKNTIEDAINKAVKREKKTLVLGE